MLFANKWINKRWGSFIEAKIQIFSSNEFSILGDIGFLPYLPSSRRVPLCCLMKLSVYRANEQSQILLSTNDGFSVKKEGRMFLFSSEVVEWTPLRYSLAAHYLINYDRFVNSCFGEINENSCVLRLCFLWYYIKIVLFIFYYGE